MKMNRLMHLLVVAVCLVALAGCGEKKDAEVLSRTAYEETMVVHPAMHYREVSEIISGEETEKRPVEETWYCDANNWAHSMDWSSVPDREGQEVFLTVEGNKLQKIDDNEWEETEELFYTMPFNTQTVLPSWEEKEMTLVSSETENGIFSATWSFEVDNAGVVMPAQWTFYFNEKDELVKFCYEVTMPDEKAGNAMKMITERTYLSFDADAIQQDLNAMYNEARK